MTSLTMLSNGKGIRSLWVSLSYFLLFLCDYVDLRDDGEQFAYASSVNEDGLQQNLENLGGSIDQTSDKERPVDGNTVFRIPIRRSSHERISLLGNIGFPSIEKESFPESQSKPRAQVYPTSHIGVITRPEPVASIPVCEKPAVESFLKHAFDILVHNQHLYLSLKAGKKRDERDKSPEENNGDFSAGNQRITDSSFDKDELDGRQQVPEAEDVRKERRGEHADMSPVGLMAEPSKTSRLSSIIFPWKRGHMKSDNDERGLDTSSFYATSASSSAQKSHLLTNWHRESTRLLTPQKSQKTGDGVTGGEEFEQVRQFLQKTALLSAGLTDNLKFHESSTLLWDIGRAALPNEPADAVVYLSFLLEDKEAMSLWRDHIVRHVSEKFTFSSCNTGESCASLAAGGEGEKMEGTRANEEKEEEMQEAKQTEGERKSAEGKQMYSLFFQWLRDASGIGGGSTGAGEDNEQEREEVKRDYEKGEKEEVEEGKSTRVREEQMQNARNIFEELLYPNGKPLQEALLAELQEQFWMSRPASSVAAVKMIERATHKNPKKEDGNKDLEGDTQRSSQETSRGVWTPEVSLRFRYISMKDAQRMMGTFLTSNLHPEYGFRTGTKLPPQEKQMKSKEKRATAPDAMKTGDIKEAKKEEDEEDEKEKEKLWLEETEAWGLASETDETGDIDGKVDEKEEKVGQEEEGDEKEEEDEDEGEDEEDELPDQFDAREAFPNCKDIIGHVRDQGSCGSCWAFSSTTSFNDRLCIKSEGEMQQLLSPQHTTSCCDAVLCASFGCNGGEPGLAWRWFHSPGVVSGGDYDTLHQGKTCWPYEIPFCNHHASSPFPDCEGDEGNTNTPECRSECEEEQYTKSIHPFNKDLHRASRAFSFPTRLHAKRDIMRAGSISAAFMVYEDFLNYKEGVYKHVYGLPIGGHAVKVIGWGKEAGEEYWLIVNSWNSYWGENGLVKFRMGEAENEDVSIYIFRIQMRSYTQGEDTYTKERDIHDNMKVSKSGIDQDLVAGDVVWKPELHTKLVEEKTLSDADGFTSEAEPTTRATYREL